MERCERIEEILGLLEDTALGFLAKERESKFKASDYLDISAAEKKIRLKKLER